jgi:hypothetical protein
MRPHFAPGSLSHIFISQSYWKAGMSLDNHSVVIPRTYQEAGDQLSMSPQTDGQTRHILRFGQHFDKTYLQSHLTTSVSSAGYSVPISTSLPACHRRFRNPKRNCNLSAVIKSFKNNHIPGGAPVISYSFSFVQLSAVVALPDSSGRHFPRGGVGRRGQE